MQPSSVLSADDCQLTTEFLPPRWLRNAHVQSVLPSLQLLRPAVARRAQALLRQSREYIVDCGGGVRLLGYHSPQPRADGAARHLVVLLHGWEGSADSNYILSLGARLYAQGCDVFRLNFRDHGPTHHLNRDLFHSCRIDEVVGAVRGIQALIPAERLSIAGFSLGGNFALRVAARAPAAGIRLARAVAVCPVLRPHATMEALESGWALYHHYFMLKWRRSLRIKQRCFPNHYDFSEIFAMSSIGAMTDVMVRRFSEFPDLDAYLNGYAIVDGALRNLEIPSHIIAALDDPIIPMQDLRLLTDHPRLQITATRYGGHCGFMQSIGDASWADRQAARLLDAG